MVRRVLHSPQPEHIRIADSIEVDKRNRVRSTNPIYSMAQPSHIYK